MIIKGGSRSNGKFFASHLTNDRDAKGNDRAELCEMRGVTANTVDGFFRETATVASGTDCINYFYHANINPQPGETLTAEQWTAAVDLLEKNLGLEGQPRFVMEHDKDGRVHRHVVWSRIDIDTMTARSDSLTYRIHERSAREMEIKFDLERGTSVLDAGRETARPERRPEDWAGFRAQKSGIDPAAIKAEMSELWRAADSGQAFVAAVTECGYSLARGDRRDFVLVDHAGDDHSLARRLEGVKAADVRERMADVDQNAMPSVAEARTAQQARFTRDGTFDRAAAVQAWENRRQRPGIEQPHPEPQRTTKPEPELGRDAAAIRQAWTHIQGGTGAEFATAMKGQGYILAAVSAEEARASERARDYAKAIGRFSATLKEGEIVAVNEYGRVARISERTTGDTREGIHARLAGINRREIMSVTAAQEAMKETFKQQRYEARQAARPTTRIESEIIDALEGRGGPGPFSRRLHQAGLTIARATAADIEQQKTEHWDRQGKLIEWDQREPPRMNEGDLFAITRTGKAMRLNPFKLDFAKIEQRLASEQLQALRAPKDSTRFVEGYDYSLRSIADVRAEQTAARTERAEMREQRRLDGIAKWEADKVTFAPHERGQSWTKAEDAVGRGSLMVADKLTGALTSLAEFVADLFGGSGGREPLKPNLYDQAAQRDARERTAQAIESLRECYERGASLRGEDLRNLSPEHLKSLAARGDDAMRALLMREDQEREQDRSYSRDR